MSAAVRVVSVGIDIPQSSGNVAGGARPGREGALACSQAITVDSEEIGLEEKGSCVVAWPFCLGQVVLNMFSLRKGCEIQVTCAFISENQLSIGNGAIGKGRLESDGQVNARQHA